MSTSWTMDWPAKEGKRTVIAAVIQYIYPTSFSAATCIQGIAYGICACNDIPFITVQLQVDSCSLSMQHSTHWWPRGPSLIWVTSRANSDIRWSHQSSAKWTSYTFWPVPDVAWLALPGPADKYDVSIPLPNSAYPGTTQLQSASEHKQTYNSLMAVPPAHNVLAVTRSNHEQFL